MTTFINLAPVACTAVLRIDDLPRRLRPVVEELMYAYIPSASELEIPGIDPLEATWFTRWERSADVAGAVSTRQVITGLDSELADFGAALDKLRATTGFSAELRLVD
ncbi:hypothetical protein CKALI_03775 [Corynebacterium kalinowskii]|uniref:Uncharacterized protein n=1 Tax=Corynebacterium kalinowskii TaxID=2675216 RepID=A0A6B8VSC4_9CORY|nr:hypothetical protein [Corynebacterium kalinowskii]QGU01636.1 hypothetical protein CKALI_03775 [Corynebacterium kalinowskii]